MASGDEAAADTAVHSSAQHIQTRHACPLPCLVIIGQPMKKFEIFG